MAAGGSGPWSWPASGQHKQKRPKESGEVRRGKFRLSLRGVKAKRIITLPYCPGSGYLSVDLFQNKPNGVLHNREGWGDSAQRVKYCIVLAFPYIGRVREYDVPQPKLLFAGRSCRFSDTGTALQIQSEQVFLNYLNGC